MQLHSHRGDPEHDYNIRYKAANDMIIPAENPNSDGVSENKTTIAIPYVFEPRVQNSL